MNVINHNGISRLVINFKVMKICRSREKGYNSLNYESVDELQ